MKATSFLIPITLVCLAVLNPAFAQKVGETISFTTKSGKNFQDVIITRLSADALVVTHKVGITSIPFEQLPDDLAKAFGFDAEKARQARATRANAAAIRNAEADAFQQSQQMKSELRQNAEDAKKALLSITKQRDIDIY